MFLRRELSRHRELAAGNGLLAFGSGDNGGMSKWTPEERPERESGYRKGMAGVGTDSWPMLKSCAATARPATGSCDSEGSMDTEHVSICELPRFRLDLAATRMGFVNRLSPLSPFVHADSLSQGPHHGCFSPSR